MSSVIKEFWEARMFEGKLPEKPPPKQPDEKGSFLPTVFTEAMQRLKDKTDSSTSLGLGLDKSIFESGEKGVVKVSREPAIDLSDIFVEPEISEHHEEPAQILAQPEVSEQVPELDATLRANMTQLVKRYKRLKAAAAHAEERYNSMESSVQSAAQAILHERSVAQAISRTLSAFQTFDTNSFPANPPAPSSESSPSGLALSATTASHVINSLLAEHTAAQARDKERADTLAKILESLEISRQKLAEEQEIAEKLLKLSADLKPREENPEQPPRETATSSRGAQEEAFTRFIQRVQLIRERTDAIHQENEKLSKMNVEESRKEDVGREALQAMMEAVSKLGTELPTTANDNGQAAQSAKASLPRRPSLFTSRKSLLR
eukprot:c22688_g1_i1.p1 GENE.c22688_g1_i1~~c22688_g1_i1.p1  ORF type:complete len:377 (+),score=98.03 c22688_g1_i1:30-1160(+)